VKVKIFRGPDTAALEKDVNAWLDRSGNDIAVVRSETDVATIRSPSGEVAVVFVTVWFEPRKA
jgi:hypothetical protein